jgi:hypothetical protein
VLAEVLWLTACKGTLARSLIANLEDTEWPKEFQTVGKRWTGLTEWKGAWHGMAWHGMDGIRDGKSEVEWGNWSVPLAIELYFPELSVASLSSLEGACKSAHAEKHIVYSAPSRNIGRGSGQGSVSRTDICLPTRK